MTARGNRKGIGSGGGDGDGSARARDPRDVIWQSDSVSTQTRGKMANSRHALHDQSWSPTRLCALDEKLTKPCGTEVVGSHHGRFPFSYNVGWDGAEWLLLSSWLTNFLGTLSIEQG